MKRIIIGGGVLASVLLSAGVSSAQRIPSGGYIPLATRCGLADVRGSYGFFRTGVNPQGPIAAIGVGQFDGDGNMITTQSTNRNGTVTQGSFPGRYEVTEDCRGAWFDAAGAVIGHFVLLDGGNEFFFLSLSAGNTIAGHGKRIEPRAR